MKKDTGYHFHILKWGFRLWYVKKYKSFKKLSLNVKFISLQHEGLSQYLCTFKTILK